MASGKNRRVIISGGGTGGHVFPAIAIANALKKLDPSTEILFVGAEGRLEMEKVPAAGYRIVGLDIRGIQRRSLWKNLLLPVKLFGSVRKSLRIIKEFRPDAAVGVGGYASGPLLLAASFKKIPYLIQEQNSFAGVTNKRLSPGARKICVAFEGMERFFPAEKIVVTGNPVRRQSVDISSGRLPALASFGLAAEKKTLLVLGGSLGARTLNDSILNDLDKIMAADLQLIWQTGKHYYEDLLRLLGADYHPNLRMVPFLNQIGEAYAAADVIISRAGAGTIAELCIVGKPVILVPSPNVAEDHQTRNAKSLVQDNACVYVPDRKAGRKLVDTALELLADDKRSRVLAENIRKLALPEADETIAREVFNIMN